MKFIVALIALIVAVNAVTIEEATEKWNVFKTTHSKQYHPKEEQLRFTIFQENLRKIEEHNAKYESGEVSYYFAVTGFADLTSEEFKAMLNSQMSTKPKMNNTNRFVVDPEADVPDSIDWREKGAVLPVKNQGNCGACWAFSATGALEGQIAIKNGKQQSLSEQQLVDCSTKNGGCDGGWMDWAFDYVKEHGICSEDSYAYLGVDSGCKTSCDTVLSTISGYVDVDANEKSLQEAVGTVGPVSIAVSASIEWQLYGGGVFSLFLCNFEQVNHGVLAVGYTDQYWIIKNSWGTSWGEQGYIRLIKGRNECHVSDIASYPVL
ncbi:procathepsin L-like [Diorhabda sublineata]|uniref:procathepsin L-like n=1 Tax=Diorhabda sublineata TaxID=1163346 RepID=UPI0024E10812|nr:procathepsin L-like [Diorhabda sublineata]